MMKLVACACVLLATFAHGFRLSKVQKSQEERAANSPQTMLSLLNEYRRSKGKSSNVRLCTALSSAAKVMATDLANGHDGGRDKHTGSDGSNVTQRVNRIQNGVCEFVGENLITSTCPAGRTDAQCVGDLSGGRHDDRKVLALFKTSTGHDQAMLSSSSWNPQWPDLKMTHLGYAVKYGPRKNAYVQVFGYNCNCR